MNGSKGASLPTEQPIENQSVRIGVSTLIVSMCGIVSLVIAAVLGYAALPKKEDLIQALSGHDNSITAHGIDHVREAVGAQSHKIADLEEAQRDTSEDVKYIRARVDFLTEQSILKGTDPKSREVVRRAASNVRERAQSAGEPDDPLKGLDLEQ